MKIAERRAMEIFKNLKKHLKESKQKSPFFNISKIKLRDDSIVLHKYLDWEKMQASFGGRALTEINGCNLAHLNQQ